MAYGFSMFGLRSMALVAASCALIGCESAPTDDAQQTSVRDTQDAALRDPFSYGPGGKTGTLQPKDNSRYEDRTLKGDWDRFMNP